MREQDPNTSALYELRSMIGHVLRSPPLAVAFPSISSCLRTSPAAFGLLFMGISTALVLFGILTFFIGFVLMPLVFMLLLLFYFARLISKLFDIARFILYPATTPNYCNKYGISQAEVSGVYLNNQERSLRTD